MEMTEFIQHFAEQFEETEASVFTSDLIFRDLDEWSSLSGLMIIGMVQDEYGKQLKADALRKCTTVEDVFNVVKDL